MLEHFVFSLFGARNSHTWEKLCENLLLNINALEIAISVSAVLVHLNYGCAWQLSSWHVCIRANDWEETWYDKGQCRKFSEFGWHGSILAASLPHDILVLQLLGWQHKKIVGCSFWQMASPGAAGKTVVFSELKGLKAHSDNCVEVLRACKQPRSTCDVSADGLRARYLVRSEINGMLCVHAGFKALGSAWTREVGLSNPYLRGLTLKFLTKELPNWLTGEIQKHSGEIHFTKRRKYVPENGRE